jgi:alkylhydroperoxidase family enzyme
MTPEHRATPEEKAYGRVLDETWEMSSEAARTIIGEAQSAAYAANMVRSYCFQPEEYDEAMEKMRLAAAKLSDRERELLAKLWRAALAAAASIDSEDFETLAGYRVYSGDLHWYYRMLSGMVEKILEEKRLAELQKEHAEREPEDNLGITL